MSKKKTADIEATAKPKVSSNSKTAEQGGFCVYIGPTILNVIQNGTIYPGDKEAVLKSIADAVKRYPLIELLIVTDKTLPVDRIKVKTPGNYLYVLYHMLENGQK